MYKAKETAHPYHIQTSFWRRSTAAKNA